MRDVAVAGAIAKMLANVPGSEGQSLMHQVMIWRLGEINPRLITVAQADEAAFDPDAMEAFLDRFITEIRPVE
jgi:hypothetical protein